LGIQFLYVPSAKTDPPADVVFKARTARVVSGSATRTDQELRLALDARGRAIIAVPIPRVKSTDYPFLHLAFADTPDKLEALLLWRTSRTGEEMFSHQIRDIPRESMWLGTHELAGWTADITELGVMLLGQPGDKVTIKDISIFSASLPRQLKTTYSDWTTFFPWRHSAINTHKGVRSASSPIYPVPVMAIVLALSLLAYAFYLFAFRASLHFDKRVVATLFLACWLGLDLLWQGRLLRQLGETYATFSGKDTPGRLAVGLDGELVEFIAEVRQQLESTGSRVFVSSADDYLGMRGAYYLYPYNVFWARNGPELPRSEYLRSGDYIVLVKPSELGFDPVTKTLRITGREVLGVEPIISHSMGRLFRVK